MYCSATTRLCNDIQIMCRLETTADPWLEGLFPALVKHFEQNPPCTTLTSDAISVALPASDCNATPESNDTPLDELLPHLQLGSVTSGSNDQILTKPACESETSTSVIRHGIPLRFKDRTELYNSQPNLVKLNTSLEESNLNIPVQPHRFLQLNCHQDKSLVSTMYTALEDVSKAGNFFWTLR